MPKKTELLLVCLYMAMNLTLNASDPPAVIGFCIASPGPDRLDQFISFIENDLAKGGINTLVLRIDYNYEYESYPNLRSQDPLSKKQVKQLVETARKNGIRLIPQINLLGHQSWHSRFGKLLEEYPQFDENPSVKLPEKYEWPNEDGLYCKSYCPLHPEVHNVVFALVDELMEVFEAEAFHAGMDEVFYIGEDECPRCSGKDKAELFAGEVNLIRDHLAENGQELWIWGDRMLEGRVSGLGIWEASGNDTHRSIDLIQKDVVICDWHYERADPTAAVFAMKGYRVITCPYRDPEVTRQQLQMFDAFRKGSANRVKGRYYGFIQTIWSDAGSFLDQFYTEDHEEKSVGQVGSLNEIINYYKSSK